MDFQHTSPSPPELLTPSPTDSPKLARVTQWPSVSSQSLNSDSGPPSPAVGRHAFFDPAEEKQMHHADGKYFAHHAHDLSEKGEDVAKDEMTSVPSSDLQELLHAADLPAPRGMDQLSTELKALYTSFQKCLDIRDRYIGLSRQRIEDDPRNSDGRLTPSSDKTSVDQPKFPPWKIYPPPPRPHWEDRDPFSPGNKSVYGESDPFQMEHCEIPKKDERPWTFRLDSNGVYQVHNTTEEDDSAQPVFKVPTIKEYFMDLDFILSVISDGPAKSFAFRRLKYLESKWNLWVLLNEYQELASIKRVPHRDFYNVRKVDTHVHHSASMNQKHLLRFIKSKMKRSPNDTVIIRDGKELSLRQVFERLNLTAYDLSIDTLDMHAHNDSFHRFDKFNLKYNPMGQSALRDIFLKTDNHIQGRYLAELTKEIFADLEQSKYQMAEYRISIYGRSKKEWDNLAKWIIKNKLFSHNVRWLIQIPRLYDVFKANSTVENFEDLLKNIFEPLFEVTQDPSTHPELHVFLQRVIGFDCVDDESKPEKRIYRKFPLPKEWNTKPNPPYSYWLYYLYANITSLNAWRCERGFCTFLLRPHAGEAGDPDHLASAFITSHSISHGILLRKVPALMYLFYLRQIGLAMSPLSNNALFLTYERNPFPNFFKVGLNVSLSTDDPLQFHFTKEPLLEEYSIAAQIYKLSPADMSELARNSVLQSGFEMEVKRHWLGESFHLPGVAGNDIQKTNVPDIRVAFRWETLEAERNMIAQFCEQSTGYLERQLVGLPQVQTDSTTKVEAGVAAMGVTAKQMNDAIPGISVMMDSKK